MRTIRPIAIACGDHAGIGPEVALKSVAAECSTPGYPGFVLVGDRQILVGLNQSLGLFPELPSWHEGQRSPVGILDPGFARDLGATSEGGKDTALAALAYLRRAAEGCSQGAFAALVTGPVSKERILRAGVSFTGQTEFLADLAGSPQVTMMLLGDDDRGRWLRVGLVTTHLRLKDVAASVTTAGVERAIRQCADACHRLRLDRARIVVCGLNPHAGEGGMLGDEEGRIIEPAIARARAAGCDVVGPVAGDTAFYQAVRGDYDAVVAMYHDQGLAPLKALAFERGVNWTLGLPFIRTSPDHGTAFDIAGRDKADPSSMLAAIRLAWRLAGD